MNWKAARLFDADGDINQRWFVFYYFKDPVTGKFRRFRQWIPMREATRSHRYAAAKELMSRINRRLQNGFNPFLQDGRKPKCITEALDYFLEIKKGSCRKRSYHTYSNMITRFREFLKENAYEIMILEDFVYSHAQNFMDWYKRRGVTNRTYNYALMHIGGVFNLLVERDWIQVNPFKKIHRLPVEDTEIIAYTEEERELIRSKLPGYNFDLWVIACLVYYCFLRPQEIVRLRVRHFHIREGFIAVPGSVAKGRRMQTIDIPGPFIEDLKKLDLNFPSDYFVFTRHLKRGPKEAAPTRIAEAWKEFRETIGIRKGIYALKHTGNGLASDIGITVRDLQLHNRHHSLSMTQGYLDRFRKHASDKLLNEFPRL